MHEVAVAPAIQSSCLRQGAYPRGDSGVAPRRARAPPEPGQDHDEGDEVQDERHDGVEVFLKQKKK